MRHTYVEIAKRIPQELVERAEPMRARRRPSQCTHEQFCWVKCGPTSVSLDNKRSYCVQCGGTL
jgi:hypothetical protein